MELNIACNLQRPFLMLLQLTIVWPAWCRFHAVMGYIMIMALEVHYHYVTHDSIMYHCDGGKLQQKLQYGCDRACWQAIAF